MAIANAIQRDSYVYLYDERGVQICAFALPGSRNPPDGLVSFTANSVNVRSGAYIFTYNEQGIQTGSYPG